jgi:hypothetical protein
VATLVLTLVGCSTGSGSSRLPSGSPGASDPAPLPSASAETSPGVPSPTPAVFESARHLYRLEVPLHWSVTEHEGSWTSIDELAADTEVPGEDVIAPRSLIAFLVMNSMAIPGGMSADEWHTAVDERVVSFAEPTCPATKTTGSIGGEPAAVLDTRCFGSIFVGRTVAHGGRGYYFSTRRPDGLADVEASLDTVIESIAFVHP